jgi:hypothetical protein
MNTWVCFVKRGVVIIDDTVMNFGELLRTKSMKYSQLRSPQTNPSRTDAQNGRAHLHGHLMDVGVAPVDDAMIYAGGVLQKVARGREG